MLEIKLYANQYFDYFAIITPVMMLTRFIYLCVSILFIVSCKEKKAKSQQKAPQQITAADFAEHFPSVNLPYSVNDSVFNDHFADSLRIEPNTLNSFMPDSVLSRLQGKNDKAVYYPLAKYVNKDAYLFLKQSQAEKKSILLLVLDKSNAYVAVLPILNNQAAKSSFHTVTLDKSMSVTRTITVKNTDGSISDGRDVYALNNASHKFDLIMTDSIGDNITQVVNPIDTLPHTIKGTGDYGSGKLNLISLRDGKKPGVVEFYIYLDKNNDGECVAELSGIATIKSPGVAIFKKDGELCSLEFRYDGNNIHLKELESCGTHRSLRCTFDGTYPRKKEIKKIIQKSHK